MSGTPPHLAEWLLERILPRDAREDVLGDLQERFDLLQQQRGHVVSHFWYWRQVGSAVFRMSTYKATGRWTVHREHTVKGDRMFTNLLQEARQSLRTLTRNPGLTATLLLTIGLAVGANTTVFTLVNALLLEQPPVIHEPQRLVRITNTNSRTNFAPLGLPDYRAFRDNSVVFSGFAAHSSGAFQVAARTDGGTSGIGLGAVSWNFFDLLGVQPALGRNFLSEEDITPGSHPVMIISDRLWQRFFGGSTDVIGATLLVNGVSFTVIGVVQPQYRGLSAIDNPPDGWIPIMALPFILPGTPLVQPEVGGFDNWLTGIARLKPGVSPAEASANMTAVAQQYYTSLGVPTLGAAVHADFRFSPPQAAAIRRTMMLLSVAAGLVLAVACANIASLLLARATARRSELAVRGALGAGRGRLVRLLLAESVLVAWLGGVVGFAFAFGATRFATALLPLSLSVQPAPDWHVAGYVVVVSTLAALAFGVAPAIIGTRQDISSTLRLQAGKGGRQLTRSILVTSQAAISLVLITAAGLFVQSSRAALSTDLGFDVETGLVAGIRLPQSRYTVPQGKQFIRNALTRLSSLSGIEAAGSSLSRPLGGESWGGSYVANDSPHPPDSALQAGFDAAGPGYFRAMGIPILEGRGFTDRDDESAPLVVVVNETLARTVWPGESPVGKTIARDPGEAPFTVVGLVRDATHRNVGEDQLAFMYYSQFQRYYRRNFFLTVRTADPSALLSTVRGVFEELDPNLVVSLATVREFVEIQIGRYRVSAFLAGFFAFVALLMTAVGLYGTIGYLTTRRAPEFAIRTALGARPGTVTGIVLGHGLKLVGIGLVLGAAVSVGASRFLRGVLFEIDPGNPVALFMSMVVLMGVAGLASYLPARRAGRADPAVMLRVE